MLSIEDIRLLLDLLSEQTVVPRSTEFPFRITRLVRGYSDGPVGTLQSKLSIMLEMMARRDIE